MNHYRPELTIQINQSKINGHWSYLVIFPLSLRIFNDFYLFIFQNSFKQITYSIASSSAHEVDTYFNIIPTTGRINVKAALTGSNSVFYNVGILTTSREFIRH
jgi:hypothetical protein